MTKSETICQTGPNNFAMIPRIAMIELTGHEFTLYANLLDLAHPKTNKAQLSNKRLASRVGCTVKTLKKHRSRLCELGYIRLFYRDHYGQLVAIDDTTNIDTWDAIIVEIIDIWDANCRFTAAYKQKPENKLAVLQNFMPTPQIDLQQGSQDLPGGEPDNEHESDSVSLIESSVGGVNNLQGSEELIHPAPEENIPEGDVKIAPNIINKDLLQENNNKLDQKDLRDKRDDFLLDDIFVTEAETIQTDTTDQTLTKPAQWDKAYTPEELEHFQNIVSLSVLETDVYNPCHQTSQLRSSFRTPTKTISEWQQLIAVVEEFFPSHSVGYATKIAQQLANSAKSGQRKEFGISPAMDAVEACAFAYWLREGEQLDNLPERSERIQERSLQFRALANHFEHVNFARYILADLLASQETPVTPEPDPNLFTPAPTAMQEKVYAEVEAILGFSLSGDV